MTSATRTGSAYSSKITRYNTNQREWKCGLMEGDGGWAVRSCDELWAAWPEFLPRRTKRTKLLKRMLWLHKKHDNTAVATQPRHPVPARTKRQKLFSERDLTVECEPATTTITRPPGTSYYRFQNSYYILLIFYMFLWCRNACR